ncbi:MAG TPA: MOSC domain-containing protein [Guyparkeria sp.]|nr:MOSC domain-containing protein [Guyparkeria sp.]
MADAGAPRIGGANPDGLIRAVLTGRLAPLGRHGVASGICKKPLDGTVKVTREGLCGDEQGDKKHHGGPEKAVHHYPYDHYPFWRQHLPELQQDLFREGGFGENVSTVGLTEFNVCVGDIYRVGDTLLQVSQARQPCWRLNERFGEAAMAQRVQDTALTGWYYRVLEEGCMEAGDRMKLVERPAEDWSLQRVLRILYQDTLNRGELAQLAQLSVLTESWRELARRRLEHGVVEDWSRRLITPEKIPLS